MKIFRSLLLASTLAFGQTNYRMEAVAGTTAIGDGAPANSALLSYPNTVLADDKGGFYVSDQGHARIRYVAASGVINTVVGAGYAGLTPDGVPARENTVTTVSSMVLNTRGELYFADQVSCIVSRLDAQGIVRRVAGISRSCGFSGDQTAAVRAQLNGPSALAFDPQGRLLIADQNNGRIRRVNTDGTIETLAGTGNSQTFAAEGLQAAQTPISFPTSLAVAADGTIYFAEFGYRRVRRILPDGRVTTVAGTGSTGNSGDGGQATLARFRGITSIALDATRNRLYICDNGWQRVRVVNLGTGVISNAAGIFVPSASDAANSSLGASFSGDGGSPIGAGMSGPYGVAVDANGGLLIADLGNHRIRLADTTIRTVAGRFRNTAETSAIRAEISPTDLAITPAGELLVNDVLNGLIRRVARNGNISTVAGTAPERSPFESSRGDNGPALSAAFELLAGLAVDAAGRIYVTDGSRVRRIDGANIAALLPNNAPIVPVGALAVDPTRNLLYAVSTSTHKVLVADVSQPTVLFRDFAGTGTAGFSGDGGQARSAQLSGPTDIAVDPAGNVYLVDSGVSRIRRVDISGVITTIIGNGTRATAETVVPEGPALETAISPVGIAVDAAGRVTLAEGRIPMIRQFDPATRRVRRIAGETPGGLAATGSGAASVTVDSTGSIYFTTVDNIIRVLRPLTASRFEAVSGTGQSAPVNTKLATPLVVRAASADGPLAGVSVGFSATGATVSPASAMTDAEGLARTEVTLGGTLGPVTITATVEGLTPVTFQATATAAVVTNPNRPAIRAGGVATAGAFGGLSTISPGTWIEIFGSNLATATRPWGGDDFRGAQAPTELDGVKVSVNNQAAFVAFISPNQINAQVPGGIGTGMVPVTVTNTNGTSESFMINAAAASPALLAPPVFSIGGVQYVVALHQDGAFVGREGLIPGANFRPARAGDVLTLYGVGFGATTPAVPPGVVVSGTPALPAVAVRLGDTAANVLFAGLAPSAVGLYQFNIVVPAGVPEGDVALSMAGVNQRLSLTVAR